MMESLTCGCLTKDNFVVEACERHRPAQIGMEWTPKLLPLREPNRFCPYEALDSIDSVVGDLAANQHFHPVSRRYDEIHEYVERLRAYMTGMER